MKTLYEMIDEIQQWLRENQAKGSDDMYMEKVKEMRELMAKAYN
jgi:hypothetical protein